MKKLGVAIKAANDRNTEQAPELVREYLELYKQWESLGTEIDIIKSALRDMAGLKNAKTSKSWEHNDMVCTVARTSNLKSFQPKDESWLRAELGDEVDEVFVEMPKITLKKEKYEALEAALGGNVEEYFTVKRAIVAGPEFKAKASEKAWDLVRYADQVKVKAI